MESINDLCFGIALALAILQLLHLRKLSASLQNKLTMSARMAVKTAAWKSRFQGRSLSGKVETLNSLFALDNFLLSSLL